MQWLIVWRGAPFAIWLFGSCVLLGSCGDNTPIHSSAAARLQPAASVPAEPAARGTIYVPVYSSVYLGVAHRAQTIELAATVSIRNVSARHPITLDQVRYFDSNGRQVRDYLDQASTLPPMGAVEFVVQRLDKSGGPGANFLIQWHADAAVDEPLAEAVMLGQNGNAGISFSSRGRVLTASPER